MNCQQVQDKLVERMYCELSDTPREEVEDHLRACSECRASWQALRESANFLDTLRADGSEATTPVDVESLYDRESRSAQQRLRRWRAAAWVAVAASILIGIAASWTFRIELRADSIVIGWGDADQRQPAEPPQPAEGPGDQAVLVQRLDGMKSQLDALIEESRLAYASQQYAVDQLGKSLVEIRERGDVRWKTSSLVWRRNREELDSVRSGIQGLVRLVYLDSSLAEDSRP